MAKYTSDTNLIRGAAAVGASMLPQDMSGLDPIIKQGMDMAKDALQQRKDILNKLDKTAENVILKSGALGQNLYNHTTELVNGYKDMYLQGMRTRGPEGEKMKMDALMNMQNHSVEIQDLKQLNQDFAKLQSEGKLSDAMNDNNLIKNKQLEKMMANDYKVSTNEQGQMQYDMEIDGKTYSLTKEQYRDLPILKHYKVGTNFGKQVAASYNLPSFNDFSFRSSVLSSLPDNVNELRAAMADGIQGVKFGEILAKYTTKEEVTAAFDTDGTVGISDDEYNNFLDAVINPDNPSFDLELTKNIMADKLTMHGKSLWQEGQTNRQRSRQTQGGRGSKERDTIFLEKLGQYVDIGAYNDKVNMFNTAKTGTIIPSFKYVSGFPRDIYKKLAGGKFQHSTLQDDGTYKVVGEISEYDAQFGVGMRMGKKQKMSKYNVTESTGVLKADAVKLPDYGLETKTTEATEEGPIGIFPNE